MARRRLSEREEKRPRDEKGPQLAARAIPFHISPVMPIYETLLTLFALRTIIRSTNKVSATCGGGQSPQKGTDYTFARNMTKTTLDQSFRPDQFERPLTNEMFVDSFARGLQVIKSFSEGPTGPGLPASTGTAPCPAAP